MFINHNISSLNAQRHVFNTNKSMDKTLERLASGLKINSGADDASGLAISEKMNAQNAGLLVANQNAQDGQALYKIAEGALNQVSSMLTRMEELGVRATNGTLTESDRIAVMDEVDELRSQINQISSTTEYNTLKILNGSMAIESHLSQTTGTSGSMRIIDKPGTLKTGTYTIEITQVGSAARIDGLDIATAIFETGVGTSGIINVNGIDISIKSEDSPAAVAAKINEVNDQTGVVAVLSPCFVGLGGPPTDSLSLFTGELDDDAANIDIAEENILAYATVGADQEIKISGDAGIWNALGTNGVVYGVGNDVEGTINGVAAKAVNGTQLEDIQAGSGSYGLVVDTDTYNGGRGIYIQSGIDTYPIPGFLGGMDHTSAIGDTATIELDISKRMRLQVGANTNQSVYNGIDNISTAQLGIGGSSKYGSLNDIELDTTDNANVSLKVIQKAIEDVSKLRSKIGATMNRLDYTIKTLSIQRENLTNAQSRIQDADISEEMTNFTKQQIMLQTGTAMLSQANARPQSVLQLLQ